MKLALVAVAAFALAGCDRIEWAKQAPPRVVDGIEVETGINIEEVIRSEPGLTKWCIARLRREGTGDFLNQTDRCLMMQAPRKWRGLWRAQFEGSQFCPEPATVCGPRGERSKGWLEGFDAIPRRYVGGLYQVEFVGRRTVYPGPWGLGLDRGFYFIVDRPISIEEVEEGQAGRGSGPG